MLSIVPIKTIADESNSVDLLLNCEDEDGDLVYFKSTSAVLFCTITNVSDKNVSLSIQLNSTNANSITSAYLYNESNEFLDTEEDLSEKPIEVCDSCILKFWFAISAQTQINSNKEPLVWRSLDLKIDIDLLVDGISFLHDSFIYSMRTDSPLRIEIDPSALNYSSIVSVDEPLIFWVDIQNFGECEVTIHQFTRNSNWADSILLIGLNQNHTIAPNQSVNMTFEVRVDTNSDRNYAHTLGILFKSDPACDDIHERSDKILLEIYFEESKQENSWIIPTLLLCVVIILLKKFNNL